MLVEPKNHDDNERKKQESAEAGSYSARRKGSKRASTNSEGLGKKVAKTALKGAVNAALPGAGNKVVSALDNKSSNKQGGPKQALPGMTNPLLQNPFHNLMQKGGQPVNLAPKQAPLPLPKPNPLPQGKQTSSTRPSILEEEREDEVLEEGEEDERVSSQTSFFSRNKKKQSKGISGDAFGDFKTFIKKSLPVLIPIAAIAASLILFSCVILVNIDNFGPMLGINTKVGGETGGEEYEAMDEEENAFYERVKVIHDEYASNGVSFDAEIIGAVYFILQTHNTELTFSDMDDSAIRTIVEAMFDSSDDETKLYNKEVFTQNLIDQIFPLFLPKVPQNQYSDIAEEIFDYIEDYKDLIQYQEPILSDNGQNTLYWWPVGSADTTQELAITYAKGEPTSTTITSYFAGRVDPFTGAISTHKGMDLVGANSTAGVENVIASLDGTVVYPASKSSATCQSFGDKSCGGGYGNYVVIQHADGNFTLYAHLHQNTITVQAGDTVKQGQVIGKMGSSGRSTGTHLHFEVRQGANTGSATVDPLNYIDPNNPRPISTGSNWSLEKSALSKSEFVAKMKDYCSRSGNQSFCSNFAAHAESVYDTAHAAGVNPELVVVTAGCEQGWKKTCGYNFYGIGIANGQGCSSGASYSTLEAGIRGYANTLAAYKPGGSFAGAIEKRYNERKAAGCDPAGYGMPGTLQGMQSVYSWLGDYRYNPGSWGKGGCVYLKLMYPNYPYCKPSTAAIDNRTPTTVCEQSDYTAFQLKLKYQYRNDIFGL